MKSIALIISIILVASVLALAVACARPASSPAPAPAPAPKPSAAPVPASKPTPLQQVIDGAKKEGAVFVILSTKFGLPETIKALQKAIKDKYGVDLNITWTASAGMAARVATAIMETKTGAPATFDLMRFSTDYIPAGMKAGAFERVDWRPLLEPGAPPEMVLQHPDLRGSIVSETSHLGLMYNPQKVSAAEVPKKFSDLADPKWKGRFGVQDYPSYFVKWAFILGKDKTLSSIRSIVKNKPVLGTAPNVNNRYLLGEIDLAFVPDTYILLNRSKGMPTAWQHLDFADLMEYPMVVQTGSRHPNAARLVGAYLASADGVKFIVQQAEGGSRFYPGNYIYDSVMEAKKAGIPAYGTEYPGLLDFMLSPQSQELQKEMELIFKQGG